MGLAIDVKHFGSYEYEIISKVLLEAKERIGINSYDYIVLSSAFNWVTEQKKNVLLNELNS